MSAEPREPIRFSIITPINSVPRTFNLVKHSVLANSNKGYEWIFILNGGKINESEPALQGIPNSRFIVTDLIGVSNARNVGIEAAVGDYILFLDADDFLAESFFARLDVYIARNPLVQCIACNAQKYAWVSGPKYKGKMNLIFDDPTVSQELISINGIGSPSGFVVLKTAAPLFPSDINFFEDYMYYLINMSKRNTFGNAIGCVYYYFQDSKDTRVRRYGIEFIKSAGESFTREIPLLEIPEFCRRIALNQVKRSLARYQGSRLVTLGYTLLLMLKSNLLLRLLLKKFYYRWSSEGKESEKKFNDFISRAWFSGPNPK
jgi:glycosyltransferase involved in cell wall biosynthesis